MSGLSTKQLEQIASIATQTALEFLEKQKKEQLKKKVDRRLRNTKLLLINYKNFKLHCVDIKHEIKLLDDPNLLENLDTEELVVEAIKRSKQRTLAMVKFIDRMIEVYKVLAHTSERPEDVRRYETIYKLYISEHTISPENLSECHKIDVRTVYRDVNEAVKTLSALIFGVDSIRFEEY